MKAVIFATLIVLKLIISSTSAPGELESEDRIVMKLKKAFMQAALVNEDAEENSGMIVIHSIEQIIIIANRNKLHTCCNFLLLIWCRHDRPFRLLWFNLCPRSQP